MARSKRLADASWRETSGHSAAESGERKIKLGFADELPRLWDEEQGDENTDVSRATELIPASQRRPGHPRFTVMTGMSAGRVFSIEEGKDFFAGRSRAVDMKLEDPGVSRVHCRMTRNGETIFVEDLGSTNGTLVNGKPIGAAEVYPGDRVQIGPNVVLQLGVFDDAEELLARSLYEASTRDGLTGAHNRRYFCERADAEIAHAARHRTPLSAILLDLDHFKTINDTVGHAAGDAVLRAVGKELTRTARASDLLCRYGGEEFALIVRTTAEQACLFAERIRARVAGLRIEGEGGAPLRVTVSIGVAELDLEAKDETTTETLLLVADRRLYRAKALGRNRVCADDSEDSEDDAG